MSCTYMYSICILGMHVTCYMYVFEYSYSYYYYYYYITFSPWSLYQLSLATDSYEYVRTYVQYSSMYVCCL